MCTVSSLFTNNAIAHIDYIHNFKYLLAVRKIELLQLHCVVCESRDSHTANI